MTRDQAKEILELYRPNGTDAADPFFSEALERLKVDPELASWFAEQQDFDRGIASACARVTVPEQLQRRIISRSRRRWWSRPLHAWEVGIAASLALLAAVSGFWWTQRPSGPAAVRDRLVQQSWSGKRHVDLETTNLEEIRRFIAAHELRSDFNLPEELAAMRPRGCRLLRVNDKKVPFIDFVDGSKHLHLIILDSSMLVEPGLEESPDFDRWNNWSTATWRQGNQTFVLTGLKPYDFVKKFRKERQWAFGG